MSMHPLKSFFRNLIKNANLFLFVVDCLLLAFYFIENFFFLFIYFHNLSSILKQEKNILIRYHNQISVLKNSKIVLGKNKIFNINIFI